MFTSELIIILILSNAKASLSIFNEHVTDITWIDENSLEQMDLKPLENILTHPEVENRNVCIVGITGLAKKGKSTLMDYCLKFLYANVSSKFNKNCQNFKKLKPGLAALQFVKAEKKFQTLSKIIQKCPRS